MMRCRVGQRSILAFVGLATLCLSAALVAQPPQPVRQSPQGDGGTNPRAGNPQAIDAGKNIYRGRCAVCHGIDAKGYRGSDLTSGDWVHGGSDAQIYKTIAGGVPGTEMPGNGNMSADEIWAVIAYLRTLSTGAPAPEQGDAARGEQVFWAKDKGNCGQCHMIGARGGRIGPNLARIGAARSVAALEREIRRPAEVIPVNFETVTIVTKDGRRVRGVRKNEDTFSIQIMTGSEELRSFMKADVTVEPEEGRSLMPAYGADRLTDAELADVVRYLRTLRGR